MRAIIMYQDSTTTSAVSLDEALLYELEQAFIGTQGVKMKKFINKSNVDLTHKTYFGSYLKEKAIVEAVNGKTPLKDSYEDFVDFFKEKEKNVVSRSMNFLGLKSSLSKEDVSFFDNLALIKSYVCGGEVQNISEIVEKVEYHRNSYIGTIPAEEKSLNNVDYVKEKIVKTRLNKAISEYSNKITNNESTMIMLPIISETLDIISSTRDNIGDHITEIGKQALFNRFYADYSKIATNPNIKDVSEVITECNQLHEKIFGSKLELIKPLFENGCFFMEFEESPYRSAS